MEEAPGRRTADLEQKFPPATDVTGGAAELHWLADGVDNFVTELQYRSGSVAAPLAVSLFVLLPASLFAVLPTLVGPLDLKGILLLLAWLVLMSIIARYGVKLMEGLIGHRDQLRWLLLRRQHYLAEIRRLDVEAEEARRSEDREFLEVLLNARSSFHQPLGSDGEARKTGPGSLGPA